MDKVSEILFLILSIIIVVGGLYLVFGILPDYIAGHFTHEYKNVTVIDKYIKRYGDHDKFFIVIQTQDGRRIVLEDRDSWAYWKWNSADLYAQIEIGKRYNIYTYGWRVPFFSWFENIYRIEPLN